MGEIQILDDDEDDLVFLSHLEAVEAEALSSSSKRRRINLPSSPQPPTTTIKVEREQVNKEGAYTAALRGSKSQTWQNQIQTQTHAPQPSSRASGGACFKCGKGHWARDCSQSQSQSQSVAPPLTMSGGVEKACPCGNGNCILLTANTDRNRGRKFYKCPIRQENGGCGFFEWCDDSSVSRASANQGTSSFTKPWNEYDKGSNSQNSSYGTAHGQKFESTDNKGYSVRSGSSCFKCGEDGHWARDCSVPTSNATASAPRANTSSGNCYKCGGSGHWAKDCTQGQSTKPRNW